MSDEQKQDLALEKEVVKEAIEEWLDKQFAKFGKWSLAAIVSSAFAYLLYGWLNFQGWHK
jgi:hypothetical protein